MATPLGTTFVTDEQIVAQDDVFMRERWSNRSLSSSTRQSTKSFSLPAPRVQGPASAAWVSTGNGPEARSEALSGAAAANCAKQDTHANASQKARVVSSTAAVATNCVAQKTRVSVSQETRVVKLPGAQHQDAVSYTHLTLPTIYSV